MIHPAAIPDLRADRRPDHACLEDPDGALSSKEFAASVRAVATELAARGIEPGDVVATKVTNRLEFVTFLFGAWRLGAAVTPVNPALTPNETRYQLEDSDARLCLVEDATAGDVAGLGTETMHADRLDALTEGGAAPPLRTEGDDVALVVYTSGTTGKPKGVVLDHLNLMAMTQMLIDAFDVDDTDRVLLVLPLFHVNGIMASVVTPMACGGTTIVVPGFDADRFWDEVERFRPTYFSAVPTIYITLNNLADDVEPDTSSLRFGVVGAAPMPPDAILEFEDRYGVTVVEGYGLSEGTVASTINPLHGKRKPGTVGPAMPGQEVRIVDDAGTDVEAGQVGEVLVRGDNVMRGYLGLPDETQRTLRDGWLHTGDVGYLDEDGYLVLVDRKKDMIIWGGENIYPKEVESVIYEHPGVLEAAVVGRPHDTYGEEPVAFVCPRPGHVLAPDALRDLCEDNLARFKVPRAVHIVDELPKNSVGKITKVPLRNRVGASGS